MLPNIKFNSAKKPLLSSVSFISLGLVFALSSICVGETIIFHSEKMTFEVHPDHCHVSGIYTFRNDSPVTVRKMLYLPFPDTGNLPFPDIISITTGTDTPVAYKKSPNGIHFPVEIQPKSTIEILITYRQATPEKYFEYILNTTMKWHFPLTSAEFIISVPPGIEIEQISLKNPEISQNSSGTRYRIYRENFRTDKNLSLRWRLK